MNKLRFTLPQVVIFFLFIVNLGNCSKLNVPRVLLPVFNDFYINFTLEATEGGCYKWTTTRQDVIFLTMIDEETDFGCSTKAIVSPITKEISRNIAVVLAEDVYTKQTLRCDVIVDAIHSLSISTTTRELFMEETPESFEVVAYDDQGNLFSTLEGVEFDWTITSLGPNKDTVLRYTPFKMSPYETPHSIDELEDFNKKGYIILLEGVKSGTAKVSVKLPNPEYKHIAPCEVQLMVVANLVLTPSDVYLMPGDSVTFKIYYLNNGKMEEIRLPDGQYYIECENEDIAASSRKSGVVTGLKVGETKVYLRDRNIGKDDMPVKMPGAVLHIVTPHHMTINVLPYRNWAILVGETHDIAVEVYSSNDNKLTLGPDVQVEITIGSEFAIVYQTANGSWLSGYGLKPNMVAVEAVLLSVKSDAIGTLVFDSPVRTKGDLLIYPRIAITPSEVILPWDPVAKPKYDISLTARGGDGKFLWSSSDNSIGVVSQTGKVHTLSSGFFEVSAAMIRNHHNRQSTKFMILPPSRLEVVEFGMETEVGKPNHIHVALYADYLGKDGNYYELPFTHCQNIPFVVKQTDNKFRQNKTSVSPPVGIACGNLAMVGLSVGTSKLTITYYHEGRALEDSVTLSAYKPLKLLQPKGEISITVGSSINLVYTGGPRPIIGRPDEHSKTVVVDDDAIAKAVIVTKRYDISNDDYTVVELTCFQLGEAMIKLMMENKPNVKNCKSQSSVITTKVLCGKPRKMALQPILHLPDMDSCPMNLGSGNVIMPGSQNLDVEVIVYDEFGVKMLNISSLELVWDSNNPDSIVMESRNSVFPENITVEDAVPVAHKSFQRISPQKAPSTFEITVEINGYRKSVMDALKITPEDPPFVVPADRDITFGPLTANLKVFIVDEVSVSSSDMTLFNHPGDNRVLSIHHGSGFFDISSSSDSIVLIKYMENSKRIEVTPMSAGDVTLQIRDLCILSRPVTVKITVVTVAIIRVEMVDKVEMGKCISCIVRLYDENDNLLEIPDMKMVNLRHSFDKNIANIQIYENSTDNVWEAGEIRYVVTGVEVGDTKLTFSVLSGDGDVVSAPIELQVFLPMKLHPRNLTLLVGSEFQLAIRGGPQPDAIFNFTLTNPNIGSISEKGVISVFDLGTSKITAQCIGTHPYTGQMVVYSRDTIEMRVIPLTGVQIQAPLTRIQVGTTVPMWVRGLPDISPLVLGSVTSPPTDYLWKVEDIILVNAQTPFLPLSIDYKRQNKLSIRVTGFQPGRTKITLNVTIRADAAGIRNMKTVTYSNSIEIEVFRQFYLTEPSDLPHTHILIAPNSELQLATNLDHTSSHITFNLASTVQNTEIITTADGSSTDPNQIITLSREGLIRSFQTLGNVRILIVAKDDYGMRQRIYITVEVKEIHFMYLKPIAEWKIDTTQPIDYIPVGTEVTLKAVFHDNIGNVFHAGPKNLQIRTSRCDLIKITEGSEPASIVVQTKKEGFTILKAWADGILKTADYVKLDVKQSVKPQLDHLTAGDVICMWTPVVSIYNVPGSWRSNDVSLVQINPALDIGFVEEREGLVVLSYTLLPGYPITLRIYPVHDIEFLDTGIPYITNTEPDPIRVVLVLQSLLSKGVKTNNLIQGWRCRVDVRRILRPRAYECYFQFTSTNTSYTVDQLFNISTGWVPETGQYSCKLTPVLINNPNVAVINSSIAIWASTREGDVESNKYIIPFIPGFYVADELNLIEGKHTATLDIFGLPIVLESLEVNAFDNKIISLEEVDQPITTLKRYNVRLLDYHWRLADSNTMTIIIESSIPKHRTIVQVKVPDDLNIFVCNASSRSPLLSLLNSYKQILIVAVTMIIIFFVTFYFYSNYMQPVVKVNVDPSRYMNTPPRSATGSFSMNRSSPHVFSPITGSSPTTAARSSNCSHPGSYNCGCRKEPIYGDASTFYSSPEIRRNRRNL